MFTADLPPSPGDADDHADDRAVELACAQARIHQLEMAVEAHEVIGRACGILMALHRMDGDRAFAAMTRVSQQTDVRVRDLAEAVITLVTSEAVVTDTPGVSAAIQLLPESSHRPAI